MKSKKDKNVSLQISINSIFDELSNIQYLQQFKDHPDFLAAQIDDLKTLIQFASKNYTQKARQILHLSKQFTKNMENTVQQVNQFDMPLYNMPQLSFPELAYEALKRGTSLQLQQEENQQLDWRAVQTEYQLKFLESKNISEDLTWQKCYNPLQRCIKISKRSAVTGRSNSQYSQRQKHENSLQIELTLKMQNKIIVWDVKKVIYQNNVHYFLLYFYKTELMQWIREQHPHSIQQSEKYVISLIHKSLDYIDVILLFMQLKSMPFNQKIQDSDKKNGILNLFDESQTTKYTYLKGKNIKICFLLPYSNFSPSIILRVGGLNVLKIQFINDYKIDIKVKYQIKEQQLTLKKLIGSLKKTKFSLLNLIDIVHEVLKQLEMYENFVEQRIEQFKLDIFLSNRSTNLLLYLKNVSTVLVEEQISENQKVKDQVEQEMSYGNMEFSGLYLVFISRTFPLMPAIITFACPQPQIVLKTSKTLCGYINKIFRNHSSITYQEVMYHLYFLQLVQQAQEKSNWSTKLVYCDIYLKNEPIIYKFKLLTQKKVTTQSSILKKETKQDHLTSTKDYSLHVKISQNFKTVQFIYVTPIAAQSQNSKNDPSMNNNMKNESSSRTYYKASENQIPEKYFKDTWRQYIKKRNDSQILKNQYLDPHMILKATHYILNHFDFNRYIKGKLSIFKNEDMVRLMDE